MQLHLTCCKTGCGTDPDTFFAHASPSPFTIVCLQLDAVLTQRQGGMCSTVSMLSWPAPVSDAGMHTVQLGDELSETRVPLMLQFAIYTAYAGRLETAFLTDEVAPANAVFHSPALTPASPRSPSNTATTAQQAEAPAAAEQTPKVCHELLLESHTLQLSVHSAPQTLTGLGHVTCIVS